jgi:hypothetical protein
VEQNSNPELVTAIVQDSGALTLQVTENAAGLAQLQIKAVDSADNYSRAQFTVLVRDPDSGNVVLMRPAKASSIESDQHEASFANDGDETTRWATQYEDDQWIDIDLEGKFLINQVILKWEAAYGKHYEFQVSEDGENWTTVFTEKFSDGEIDEILFDPVPARYVRMHGIQRGTQWGFSLWEFEVYGKRIAE